LDPGSGIHLLWSSNLLPSPRRPPSTQLNVCWCSSLLPDHPVPPSCDVVSTPLLRTSHEGNPPSPFPPNELVRPDPPSWVRLRTRFLPSPAPILACCQSTGEPPGLPTPYKCLRLASTIELPRGLTILEVLRGLLPFRVSRRLRRSRRPSQSSTVMKPGRRAPSVMLLGLRLFESPEG